MATPVSDFAGIENAQTSQRLPNFQPGSYVLKVEVLKTINTRAKGKMFIAEFEVISSTGANANPPGTKVSNVIKMSLDTALGHIKGLSAAVLNKPDSAITGAKVDALTAADNPAKGVKVKADASVIKTRENKDFTLLKFYPA